MGIIDILAQSNIFLFHGEPQRRAKSLKHLFLLAHRKVCNVDNPVQAVRRSSGLKIQQADNVLRRSTTSCRNRLNSYGVRRWYAYLVFGFMVISPNITFGDIEDFGEIEDL
jgi:hypothetical protein